MIFFCAVYNYVPPYKVIRWGLLFVFITAFLNLSLGLAWLLLLERARYTHSRFQLFFTRKGKIIIERFLGFVCFLCTLYLLSFVNVPSSAGRVYMLKIRKKGDGRADTICKQVRSNNTSSSFFTYLARMP